MQQKIKKRAKTLFLGLSISMLLMACGGGGGGGEEEIPSPPSPEKLTSSCPAAGDDRVAINAAIAINSPFTINIVDPNKIQLSCDGLNVEFVYEVRGDNITFKPVSAFGHDNWCTLTLDSGALSNDTSLNEEMEVAFFTSVASEVEYWFDSELNLTSAIPTAEFNNRFPFRKFTYENADYIPWISNEFILYVTSWSESRIETIALGNLRDHLPNIRNVGDSSDSSFYMHGDDVYLTLPLFFPFLDGSHAVEAAFIHFNMRKLSLESATQVSFYDIATEYSTAHINNDIFLSYRSHANPAYEDRGVIKVSHDGGQSFEFTPYDLPENTVARFVNLSSSTANSTDNGVYVILAPRLTNAQTPQFFSISELDPITGALTQRYRYDLPENKYLFKLSVSDNAISWCESGSSGGVMSPDTQCKLVNVDFAAAKVAEIRSFEIGNYNIEFIHHDGSDYAFKFSYHDSPFVDLEIHDLDDPASVIETTFVYEDGGIFDISFHEDELVMYVKRKQILSEEVTVFRDDLLLRRYTKVVPCT